MNKPFEVAKHLSIAEELGEVDVEDVTRMFDHDVVIVTIADTEHVRRHTVASTARCEVLNGLHTNQQAQLNNEPFVRRVFTNKSIALTNQLALEKMSFQSTSEKR